MSGYPNFNYDSFHEAEEMVRDWQPEWEPVSPARTPGCTHTLGRDYFLREAIKLLVQCDSVLLLDGWYKSSGACLEASIAVQLGMPLYATLDAVANKISITKVSEQYVWDSVLTRMKTNRPGEDGYDADTKLKEQESRKVSPYPLDPWTPEQVTAQIRANCEAGFTTPPEAVQGEPPVVMSPQDMLAQADIVVNGDRRADYGHPIVNHSRTAQYWSAFKGVEFTAEDVCWMNVLQKISREGNKPKDDNKVDVMGYVLNAAMVEEARRESAPVQCQHDWADISTVSDKFMGLTKETCLRCGEVKITEKKMLGQQ
jgi:hypothetical protein